ncbi:MAG: nucleotidyltransferase domain-containing protein [Defluviitaleaceae bacterium]|nr:nucleotidyltransferase domain-containing protein [Defluviitaleaceae bacterium]
MPKPHIQDFLQKFVTKFEQTGIDVSALILFGSQARDTATLSSDVDIAVVMKAPLSPCHRGELRAIGEEINDAIETNLFFTTQEALDAATKIFDTNKYIREEGIILWPK